MCKAPRNAATVKYGGSLVCVSTREERPTLWLEGVGSTPTHHAVYSMLCPEARLEGLSPTLGGRNIYSSFARTKENAEVLRPPRRV